jgi:hypothetical protein
MIFVSYLHSTILDVLSHLVSYLYNLFILIVTTP